MVICGDPVCADDHFTEFLQQLKAYASKNHDHIVFLMTMEKHLDEYRAEGFGCHKSGEEAKAKYNPTWKNIYIVCHPKHMSLWMDEAAFAVLDSQGFGDYIRAFLEMKKTGRKKAETDS